MSLDPVEAEHSLKISRVHLLLIKCMDRERYRSLKDLRKRARQRQIFCGFDRRIYRLPRPGGAAPRTFKHSGKAGDIIYALPTIRALGNGANADLLVALDVPVGETGPESAAGGIMVDRRMFDMLTPLLAEQPYIRSIAPYSGERVDIDLDVFRDSPLPLDRLGISRWYFYFFGITADLSKPWLRVNPDRSFGDTVLLSRSARYRNHSLDFRFLQRQPRLVFVGLEEEFRDMQRQIPRLEWAPVRDFLQMARMIAGCRLFIGNQSFPFSLAEALKVPRILESDLETPNVVPTGADAYDVLFQRQFEHIVERLSSGRQAVLGA